MGAWLAPVSRVLTHASASLQRLDREAGISFRPFPKVNPYILLSADVLVWYRIVNAVKMNIIEWVGNLNNTHFRKTMASSSLNVLKKGLKTLYEQFKAKKG